MKKIAYILFLSLFLVSCGESELVSEEENINEIIIENTDEVSVEVENEQIEEEMTKEQEQIAKNNEEKKNDNTL
ncbi:MAG: hypothetical protein P1U46_01800 [Patescibacteria group bacterium]|nr:hypothetical protein [Patescibacteria group bacterium]